VLTNARPPILVEQLKLRQPFLTIDSRPPSRRFSVTYQTSSALLPARGDPAPPARELLKCAAPCLTVVAKHMTRVLHVIDTDGPEVPKLRFSMPLRLNPALFCSVAAVGGPDSNCARSCGSAMTTA
jgi:hypothetical protein